MCPDDFSDLVCEITLKEKNYDRKHEGVIKGLGCVGSTVEDVTSVTSLLEIG